MNSNLDHHAAPYSGMVTRRRAIELSILEDERSRDLLQLRKRVLRASIYPRPKNSINRRQRSRASSVLNIFTKIALLLATSFYLGQLIWRWTSGPQWDTNSSFAALHYEDRISEVEQSLKITAKMLQVQVEVIRRKIGSEIGIVTGELKKYVKETGKIIEKELEKLESRTDDLVFSLANLENCGLLKEELMSKRILDDMDKDVALDEIITLTTETIMKEIEKHAGDGLGRVDYALGSGGAKVVRHSDPYVYGKAHKMLEPSAGEPGQCFPLRGSSGFVEIRLREAIIPEAITLEHISKRVAYDRSSAPNNCRVSGWFEPHEDGPPVKSIKRFALTNFSYDLEKSNAQTFTILMVGSGIIINVVRLDFTSNHGSSSFTCIYRIRVHGYTSSSPVSHDHISQVLEER